jgi:hypothetical protein
VTPALLQRVREMRKRMEARLAQPRPRESGAGWMQNLLVTVLRASYWMAAAWQYGRASLLAGCVWAFAWWGTGRLLRPSWSVPPNLAVSSIADDPVRSRPAGAARARLRDRLGRVLGRVLRGAALAALACAASVALDAFGVRPAPSVMLAAGLAMALLWLAVRATAGRAAARAEVVQVLVSLATATATIGAMY